MSTLYFEKLSQYDRAAEPVSFSIPFAQGKLPGAAHLVIEDGGEALPSQQRALAHWSDGSVKWLLVHLQPDLPGNLSKTITFRTASDPAPPPQQQVQVTEDAGGLSGRHRPSQFSRAPRRLPPRPGRHSRRRSRVACALRRLHNGDRCCRRR